MPWVFIGPGSAYQSLSANPIAASVRIWDSFVLVRARKAVLHEACGLPLAAVAAGALRCLGAEPMMVDAMKGASRESVADFLVVGGGVAGLRAAIELARAGSVLLLSKGTTSQSTTYHARGGIAVAMGEDTEDMTLHFRETLRAGDGLCREEAVRVLVEEGALEIRRLAEWGVPFEFRQHSTASRGQPNVVRARGGSIGSEILRVLTAKANSLKSLHTKRHCTVIELHVQGGCVRGATCLDESSGQIRKVRAAAVLLATGGLGQVYAETTNPPGACGAGVALAYRAGALLADMEFIQFYPTVLPAASGSRVVLPEALRERGAKLRNLELDRFMPRYHEAGELAPPDVVSRAIITEIQRSRGSFVYLDLTELHEGEVKLRFPDVYAACLESNIDIASDLVPVRPAAHFAVGGVATDLHGATTLEGLYAAGETATTGLHGASRLANNALLEGLIYGTHAAAAMIAGRKLSARREPPPSSAGADFAGSVTAPERAQLESVARDVRNLMWDQVGVIRDERKFKLAAERLNAIRWPDRARADRSYVETWNLLEVARLITRCALARKESRGVHYRADAPLRNDSEPPQHSYVSLQTGVYFRPDTVPEAHAR